ncbi:YkgJ family cysteine cluster protein [Pendulispora rubella]|uniref:YkgJ family cysteine cluster protein n=1 Tax=Pendulispora rubella TaxID=2741070 RepID=A0ABZ2L3R5_9BACT
MSSRLPVIPSSLPCFPCPHDSICCSWGTSLNAKEAETLKSLYGDDAIVWDDEENEWRTRVDGDRCMFLKSNACSLHDRPEYPSVCRCFPWSDPETGGPYQYDLSICPELPQDEEPAES